MKKLKKISAVLLSVIMLLSALPSAYAANTLILSDPVYKDASDNKTDAPKPGFVKTEIVAENKGDAPAPACLIVTATDNATGKIAAINSYSAEVPANGSKTLSAGIEYASGQTYNYYVWDSIENHIPLRNTPPSDVKELVCSPKTNSLDLSWDEALDDKGVKNYILKVNGEEIARSKETSYSLPGLEKNSRYTCEVIACDEDGAESKNAAVIDAETYGIEECILYKNDNPNISFKENHSWKGGDSYTSPVTVEGRDCFDNTSQEQENGSKKTCFFYFPVAATYINESIRNVAVEVTYYDEFTSGAPSLQYNSAEQKSDGSYNTGKSFPLDDHTGTKTWKTVYAQLSDAKFVNPSDLTYSSFRFSSASGTKVYKVAVCPGDQYSPDSPNVKFDDNTTETYDMSFYPYDSNKAYANADGVNFMYSTDGSSFDFDIKDLRAKKTGGYVEVTYLDGIYYNNEIIDYESDDLMILNYKSAAGAKGNVEFTNTHKFKTVRIPLEAAELSNSISGANGRKFDFTISTKNKAPLALASVKYVPGDSDYVAPPKTEVYAEVSEDGMSLDGDLILSSSEIYDTTETGYDSNVLFSGKAGRSPVDGKHYLYNQEFTGFPSGKSWQRWKNAFYFKIPDDFIYNNDYNHIIVEIEYYAPSGQIELLTKNASGGDQSAGKVPVEQGQWTTKYFDIYAADGKNIVFKNSLNGCDFRINFDCQGYVHKVVVYRDDG